MAALETKVMRPWILLACLLHTIPGNASPRYATAPYHGDLIIFQYREMSYRLSRFIEPDPVRQFYSGYIYSASSPVTHSDPTGAMMGGEAVEAAIRITESPEPLPAVVCEPISPVPPPEQATTSQQSEETLLPSILPPYAEDENRLRHSIYNYQKAIKTQERAYLDMQEARVTLRAREKTYNAKRTLKHYWLSSLQGRAEVLPHSQRESVIRGIVGELGINPGGEQLLRELTKTPALPPARPLPFATPPEATPGSHERYAPRYITVPSAAETEVIDFSGYARRQRLHQQLKPYGGFSLPWRRSTPPRMDGPYQ